MGVDHGDRRRFAGSSGILLKQEASDVFAQRGATQPDAIGFSQVMRVLQAY
jgi:hypothetical protein